jgi:hypothetical protein
MKNNKDVGEAFMNWVVKSRPRDVSRIMCFCSTDQLLRGVSKHQSLNCDGMELKTPCLITGLPGSGKSWLANQISNVVPKFKLVDLNDYASQEEADKGRYVIDFNKVPVDGTIYDGEDYLGDLIPVVKTVIFMLPAFDAFRQSNQAKALEGGKKRLSPEFVKYWTEKSNLSDSQLADFLFDTLKLKFKKLGENQGFVVAYNDPKEAIRKGWFS